MFGVPPIHLPTARADPAAAETLGRAEVIAQSLGDGAGGSVWLGLSRSSGRDGLRLGERPA
jgi:hypothetical protein